jgi:hypothetical protein
VVLEEMRHRLGVPLGDGLLSNTFSLTLAASLPVDVIIPDDDVRDQLFLAMSHLRGAWKDVELPKAWNNALKSFEDRILGNEPNRCSLFDYRVAEKMERLRTV